MLSRKSIALTLSAAVLLNACAAVPEDRGFGAVAAGVNERTGEQVSWQADAEARARAAQQVELLLATPLTQDKAVRIALLNNRGLQATFAEVGIAQATATQAALPRNPVLDAGVRAPLEGGSVNLDFGLAFEFIDLLFLPARTRAAEADLNAVRLRVTGEVLSLVARTRAAFVDVQTAEAGLAFADQLLTGAAAARDLAVTLGNAGNMTEAAMLPYQQRHSAARIDQVRAQAALDNARDRLNLLLGLAEDQTDWRIDVGLPALPADPAVPDGAPSKAAVSSLEAAAARQDLIAAGERHGLTRKTALIGELETGPVADRDDGDWDIGGTAAIPLPLFDAGGARTALAVSELARAEDRYAAALTEARVAARMAAANLRAVHRHAADLQNDLLPLRQQAVRQAMARYNAMQIGLFDLLDAQAGMVRAKADAGAALGRYWKAQIALDLVLQGGQPASSAPMTATVSEGGDPQRGGH